MLNLKYLKTLASLILWAEESVQVKMQNPVVAFPITKRINAELFVDWMADLDLVDGRINNVAGVELMFDLRIK